MKALINQILELSKLEGQDSLALKPLNLSDYLAKRQEDDQTLAQAAGKELAYDLAPNLQVEADEVLLGRLVDNLLSNALKFAQSQVSLTMAQALRRESRRTFGNDSIRWIVPVLSRPQVVPA